MVKKITVCILGVIVFIIAAEACLRLVGRGVSAYQQHKNRVNLSKSKALTILCIGESTTAVASFPDDYSYPALLQKILDDSSGQRIGFRVINAGVPAINSVYIREHIEANIQQYSPDIVVAMMGINDEHIKYYERTFGEDSWLFRHVRIFRLACILWANAHTRNQRLIQSPLFLKDADNEEMLIKAIALRPGSLEAYNELGLWYEAIWDLKKMEQIYRKAIEVDPSSDIGYAGLGWCFSDQEKYLEAQDAFRRALQRNSGRDDLYTGLGWACRMLGEYEAAEQSFKQALSINPMNDRAAGSLVVVAIDMGASQSAQRYAEEVAAMRQKKVNPVTRQSYRQIKSILDEHGIVLVCCQYPMRSIEPLRTIMGEDAGTVLFVDNESTFKDEVNKHGYSTYFKDMFGGDFGHCTAEGNMLIARNIAKVILNSWIKR